MKATVLRTHLVVGLLASTSWAAEIVWQPVFDVTGTEVIFSEGVLQEAVNLTEQGIIYSLEIEALGENLPFLPVHNLLEHTTGDAQFSPPNPDLDETLLTVLGSHSWQRGDGDGEFLIGDAAREYQLDLDQDLATTDDIVLADGGFEPLIPGNDYSIQILGVFDGRACCSELSTIFSDGRGVDFGSEPLVRGIGQTVIGFFTADDTTQLIQVLSGPGGDGNDPGLSAYIVRDVTDNQGGNPACDFNGDGACDVVDIDALMNVVGDGTNGASFDLNGDTVVDDGDRDRWLADAATENGLTAPYLVGDSNLDLLVNASDLNPVGIAWQSNENSWSSGNYTGGGVDAADLNVLGINWQATHPDAPLAATVPEPVSLAMLMLGLLGIAAMRR